MRQAGALIQYNQTLESHLRDDSSLLASVETGHVLLDCFPNPDVETLWNRFVARVDSPDLYCTPHYFREPYWRNRNPFAILAFTHGEVTGVVSGLRQDREVTCGLPSRPQMLLDANSDVRKTASIMASALITEFPRARVITAYSWQPAFVDDFKEHHFCFRPLQGDVVLDLTRGASKLFQSFHDNRKRNIRAAMKHGVEVSEVKTPQDVVEYWDTFCAWRNSQRKKIHSRETLENVKDINRLPETHRRFIARYQGKPVAATSVRFCPGGLIEYAGNCSKDEFNHVRPNDLLIWRTIEWACEHGFTRYSLGASHPFLRKCGGTVLPIYRYRLDRTFGRRVELKENLERGARFAIRELKATGTATAKLFRETVGL
jgi:hypothetical protein